MVKQVWERVMFYKLKMTLQALGAIVVSLLRIARNPACLKPNAMPSIDQKSIMILGNGPSLKDVLENEQEKLKASDVFAVNKFCLSEAYLTVKPLYYVIIDPDFFLKSKDESLMQMQKDVQQKFEKETTWDMNLFLPQSKISKVYAENIEYINPKIKVYFFNTLTIEGAELFRHKFYNAGIGMPFVGNVLIAANMLAINMGYVNIELYGAEHSIHTQAYVNEKNQVALEYEYFDGSSAEFVFWDDLDPTRPQKYHEFLTHWTRTFSAYHKVQFFAKYKKCHILNMTKDSYIDAFQRV